MSDGPPSSSVPSRRAPGGPLAQSQLLAAWIGAVVGLLALVVGRALAPSLAGVWVGLDAVIERAEMGAAVLSQLYALGALALLLGLVVTVSRSALSVGLRSLAVAVTGLVAMAVASASFVQLPTLSGLCSALGAGALAIAVGLRAIRTPATAGPALLVALVGAGGAGRALTMGVVELGELDGVMATQSLPRAAATLAFACDALAVVVALAWIVGRRHRLERWLGALACLGGGVGAALFALHGGANSVEGGLAVLMHRAVHALLSTPAPAVPTGARSYVELQLIVLCVAALVRARGGRQVATAVAFALLGHGTLEAPLCAASLVIACGLLAVPTPPAAGAGSGEPAAPNEAPPTP